MAAVGVHGVSKRFGTVRALNGIDLLVGDGENVAILGPSGSGKSTLLRVIAGLENPDAGQVTLGGLDQARLPAHRRDIAIVFQHFALYPHLSSLENITLGLRYGLKLGKADAERRARETADRLRVGHLLDRKPREMSGGQRQRIALARALARRSSVVLLDEPLSGLDAQLHSALRVEIATLLRLTGATGISVTHDQYDAMATADRIAVLDDGRILQIGTPDELYATPATQFVAGFIGSPAMNFFPIGPDGRSAFGRHGPPSGEPVVLGVRPEHFQLAGEHSGGFGLTGVVTVVEASISSDRVVHLTVDGEAVAVRCPAAKQPPVGRRVQIRCAPADVHVFGGTGGERLGSAAEHQELYPSEPGAEPEGSVPADAVTGGRHG